MALVSCPVEETFTSSFTSFCLFFSVYLESVLHGKFLFWDFPLWDELLETRPFSWVRRPRLSLFPYPKSGRPLHPCRLFSLTPILARPL